MSLSAGVYSFTLDAVSEMGTIPHDAVDDPMCDWDLYDPMCQPWDEEIMVRLAANNVSGGPDYYTGGDLWYQTSWASWRRNPGNAPEQDLVFRIEGPSVPSWTLYESDPGFDYGVNASGVAVWEHDGSEWSVSVDDSTSRWIGPEDALTSGDPTSDGGWCWQWKFWDCSDTETATLDFDLTDQKVVLAILNIRFGMGWIGCYVEEDREMSEAAMKSARNLITAAVIGDVVSVLPEPVMTTAEFLEYGYGIGQMVTVGQDWSEDFSFPTGPLDYIIKMQAELFYMELAAEGLCS